MVMAAQCAQRLLDEPIVVGGDDVLERLGQQQVVSQRGPAALLSSIEELGDDALDGLCRVAHVFAVPLREIEKVLQVARWLAGDIQIL